MTLWLIIWSLNIAKITEDYSKSASTILKKKKLEEN